MQSEAQIGDGFKFDYFQKVLRTDGDERKSQRQRHGASREGHKRGRTNGEV